MFGFSLSEMIVICLVALVAVGPQKLPGMLKTMGQWARKLRKMTMDVRQQTGIDEMLRAEGIQISELRSLMRGYHGGAAPAAAAPTPAPVRPYNDPYDDIEPDPSREYPMEGADSYGALPDDLLSPAEPAPAEKVETETAPATETAAVTEPAAATEPTAATEPESTPTATDSATPTATDSATPTATDPVTPTTTATEPEAPAPAAAPAAIPRPAATVPPAPRRTGPPPPPVRTVPPPAPSSRPFAARPSGAPPAPPRRPSLPPPAEASSPLNKPSDPAVGQPADTTTGGTANGGN